MKNSLHRFFTMTLLGTFALLTVACDKDDAPAAPQEKVTGISLALTGDDKGTLDVSVAFNDPAGIDGKRATSVLTLKANTSYTGSLSLVDASKTPTEDVTGDYTLSFDSNADVTVMQHTDELHMQTGTATAGNTGEFKIMLTKDGKTQQVIFPLLISQ